MFEAEFADEISSVIEADVGYEAGGMVLIPQGLLVEGVFGQHVGEETAERDLPLNVCIGDSGVGGESAIAAVDAQGIEHGFDHRSGGWFGGLIPRDADC